jgi:hypothetical protein
VRRAVAEAMARRGGFVDSPASRAAPIWRRSSPPRRRRRRRGRRCAGSRSGSPTRRAGRSCW